MSTKYRLDKLADLTRKSQGTVYEYMERWRCGTYWCRVPGAYKSPRAAIRAARLYSSTPHTITGAWRKAKSLRQDDVFEAVYPEGATLPLEAWVAETLTKVARRYPPGTPKTISGGRTEQGRPTLTVTTHLPLIPYSR